MPASPRLVILHYYPQDATNEMIESKKTAAAGVGRMLALRRPSRVPLRDIRVGADVMVRTKNPSTIDIFLPTLVLS